MVGVKGMVGGGGARPGGGRKSDSVREMQQGNRHIMLQEVTADDLRKCARALINKALAGDEKAFRALFSYVLGAPDSELTIKGDANAPLRVEVVYMDQAEDEDDDETPALPAPLWLSEVVNVAAL